MRRRRAWQAAAATGPWAAWDDAPGSSLSTVWRRHPGLARAYTAALTAMTSVMASTGTPPDADSTDPASLRAWLTWAADVLGLPSDPPPPARPTVRRRPVPVGVWRGKTYYRLPKPAGARGDRGGHVDARARMDAATRKERLPGVSVRTYRRAVRAVLHLQQRTEVLASAILWAWSTCPECHDRRWTG